MRFHLPAYLIAELVRSAGTQGANVDLDNDDILARLADWDARYGIDVAEADWNRVMVRLDRVPADLDEFAREVYAFCPDVVDQHMASIWCAYKPSSGEFTRFFNPRTDRWADHFP